MGRGTSGAVGSKGSSFTCEVSISGQFHFRCLQSSEINTSLVRTFGLTTVEVAVPVAGTAGLMASPRMGELASAAKFGKGMAVAKTF